MAKGTRASRATKSRGNSWFASLSPLKQDLVCLGFLYLITLVLFRGIIFDNAAFSDQADTAAALTYKTAGDHIKTTEGIDPLWMPYFFSGMPTFGNVAYVPHNVSYLQTIVVGALQLLFLNATVSWMIVHCLLGGIFMFLLMRAWGFSHASATFSALTFMLSPYAIGLAQEGHGSKLQALSYLPMTFLLAHFLFEKRTLLSFGLFVAGIGTLLLTNHMQIVYYVLMTLGLYLAYQVVVDFRSDKILALKKIGLFACGIFLGLCISSYIYLSVHEYAQFSIRGGGTEGSTGGLTWDYATNWSFHPFEMMNLLIPSFFGFSSNYLYNWQGQMRPLPLYWGTMPFVSSTMYFGVLPLALSLLALVYRRNKLTIFIALLTLAIFCVSFGKHFGLLYNLLFSYLPFFNKFRAPVMILHLLPFTCGILGGIGLDVLLKSNDDKPGSSTAKLTKILLSILGVVWFLLAISFLFKSDVSSFLSSFLFERADGEPYSPQVLSEIKKIRFEVLWNDYVKFALLISAGLGAVILFLKGSIKRGMFIAIILGVLIVDLFVMDKKFINPTPLNAAEQQFAPDATITFLKSQPGLFRVFPLGEGSFMDMDYAYHALQSVAGYHPAKLKIYQTMIDSCLYKGPNPEFPLNMAVVNMLNARYIVAAGGLPSQFELVNEDRQKQKYVFRNPTALPRAFFVLGAIVASSEHEVFARLNSADFNPSTTAIVEKPLAETPIPDDSARVEITSYGAHRIVMNTKRNGAGLLVLSEVYYPAGWNAYIDGRKTEIYKTNYILRSVMVPSGAHDVEFRFEPAIYELGWDLSRASWGLSGLCILIGLWRLPSIRRKFGKSQGGSD